MIHSLQVENIALIDRLEMELSGGLNVLSGETGAGKSIIVDSMNLVLGERADREMIRTGEERACVEAVLYVDAKALAPVFEEFGIPPEEELVVSRELSVSGRNVCRVNGRTVNLSTLKGFMDHVVDLLGQHEHQSLLYAVNHLALIDGFGGKGIAQKKDETAGVYAKLYALKQELNALGGDAGERARRADLLRFQIAELENAGLRADEIEALKQEREFLQNARSISLALAQSYGILYEGGEGEASVLSGLKSCADALSRIAPFKKEYEEIAEALKESYYSLDDAARELGAQADGVLFDEARQNEVEERIEFLNGLKRKYDVADVQGLIDFARTAAEQLARLEDADAAGERLSREISGAENALYGLYAELHTLRVESALRLSKSVESQLQDLGMAGAKFEPRFALLPAPGETAYTPSGPESAEFYISTNPGEPLKPLVKIASGGEISRIMLAFKAVSAGADDISTMIFDEIDTGISGRVAHVVAEKMAVIAQSRQVVCVTHLPQIAAMADRSFLISKSSEGGDTNTRIRRLNESEVIGEIARLSGGIETKNAAVYAGELLENARRAKEKSGMARK